MLAWQIQSHDALRDQIVHGSSVDGRAQLIRGEAGIGKTTLAASVSQVLAAKGFTVLPVIGVRELSSVPLAAMAPVLALASAVTELPAAERLQRLFAIVSAAERGTQYVLAIDDSPLLDEMSAAAVYQLVRIYGVRCVMTARSSDVLEGALTRLIDDGLVDTTELTGLSDDQAAVAVRAAIEGPLEPRSLKRLVRLADGNPLFLRELTVAAKQQDAIRSTSRGLEIDVPKLPAHLRDGISARYASLDVADRTAVELLAVAQPLPVASLGAAAEKLAAGLLITVDSSGARLAHPLFGEVILAELATADAQNRRFAAANLLEQADDSGETRYRVACLRLDSEQPLAASELVWASQHADWLADYPQSLRLAEAAAVREPTAAALTTVAVAFSQLRRWDDADAAFARAAAAAESEADRALVASEHGTHLAFQRGDPAAALVLVLAVLEGIHNSTLRLDLEAQLDKWRLIGGGRLGDRAGLTGETTLQAAIVAALRAVFAGDIGAAREAIQLGEPMVEPGRAAVPHAAPIFAFASLFVLAYEGRMDAARALAVAKGSDPAAPERGMFAFALGVIELHAGRLNEALPAANSAIEALGWLDFAALRGPAIALRAAIYARLGDEPTARSTLASLTPSLSASANVVAQRAEAEAWLLAHRGHVDDAAAVVLVAAESLAELGHWGLAASTAYVAVRLGRPGLVIDVIADAMTHSPGPMIGAQQQHALAAIAADPAALTAAARALASTGQLGPAADAADHAADLFREARAREHERKAIQLAAEFAASSSDFRLRRPADRSLELTERERIIATAAAARESSKEIAERLGLSVRTVENHLARIYRKLGVASRSDLRQAL